MEIGRFGRIRASLVSEEFLNYVDGIADLFKEFFGLGLVIHICSFCESLSKVGGRRIVRA